MVSAPGPGHSSVYIFFFFFECVCSGVRERAMSASGGLDSTLYALPANLLGDVLSM